MSVLAFNESRHISSTARYAQQLYGSVSPGVRGFSHRLGQFLSLATGAFLASQFTMLQQEATATSSPKSDLTEASTLWHIAIRRLLKRVLLYSIRPPNFEQVGVWLRAGRPVYNRGF
jgi:hypothetical protein